MLSFIVTQTHTNDTRYGTPHLFFHRIDYDYMQHTILL